MTINKSQLAWSFITGFVFVVIIIGIGTVERLDDIEFLLAPGMLLSAILFQQGIHSDHANLFLFFAALFNVIIFGFLALLVIRWRSKKCLK